MFLRAMVESVSLEAFTPWMEPWQETHLGASGSPFFAACPWMLDSRGFTSLAWHSTHFPGISFSVVLSSCTLPRHEAHADSPRMEWALAGKDLASSAWHVAHRTFAIFAGCGDSLMAVWRSGES